MISGLLVKPRQRFKTLSKNRCLATVPTEALRRLLDCQRIIMLIQQRKRAATRGLRTRGSERLAFASGANHRLDTRLEGRLSTLLGHSASHSERLFLPLSRRPRQHRRLAGSGGKPTFAEAMVNGPVAPIVAVQSSGPEPPKRTFCPLALRLLRARQGVMTGWVDAEVLPNRLQRSAAPISNGAARPT